MVLAADARACLLGFSVFATCLSSPKQVKVVPLFEMEMIINNRFLSLHQNKIADKHNIQVTVA